MTSIAKQRHQAAIRQSFRCYYCGLPMWESSPSAFIDQYRLSQSQVHLLQCTGEHLHPKGDGGTNQSHNIVAACRHCNSTRHKTPKVLNPEQYQKKVQKRIRQGGWFPNNLTNKMKGEIRLTR